MEATFRLARIRGIEVGIHYSWFFVFVAFTAILALGQFPDLYEDWTDFEYWSVSIAAVLLLFLSVLLHEFGHALMAQNRGVPVRSITLFIFGGIAGLARESDTPGDEFLISIAGPAVSVVLSGVFGALWLAFGGANEQIGALLGYLSFINLLLAVFNMIPGFPLDGGRVLRAVVWRATGNLRRATRIVATIGIGLGTLFIFTGLLAVVSGYVINGLWSIAIGWFLQNAASQSQAAVEQQYAFRDIRVRDLMNTHPVTVAPWVDLQTLANDYVLAHNARGLPVIQDGRMVGIVTVTDLRGTPRDLWPSTQVQQVMTPLEKIKSVSVDAPIIEALQIMSEEDFHQVPVVEDGRLIGLLTRFELIRYLQTREELGLGR